LNKKVQIQDLGTKDFKGTWDYQEQLFKNYFLFVEHPHVYTLGKSGDVSNLLLDEKQLTEKGAKFYKIIFLQTYINTCVF